jgi:hypothetical protein
LQFKDTYAATLAAQVFRALIAIAAFFNLDIVGGRTSARRKPYKNDTRKPSNRATNKRICKYKAIIKEEN